MTTDNFNVTHSNLQDQRLICEFGKEMNFNMKKVGRKNPRDRSLIYLLKSPAIMALGISIIFLSFYPNELCDRLKLLLQEKQGCINNDIVIGEIVAIAVVNV